METKTLALIFLVVALLGFLDAAYLTAQHYLGFTLNCPVTGCSSVLTSSYSTLLGLPISLYGALYYLAILLLSVGYLDTKNLLLLKGAALLTIPGFLISLGLIYLQIFVIESICFYCLISATASTILFSASLPILLRKSP